MVSSGKIELAASYTECYVAFLDILGFRQLVGRSVNAPNVLSDLICVLTTAANLESTKHSERKSVDIGNERVWTTQIRAFSDSVAIFIPTETHALASVLCKVRYLHDRIMELHCCLRGAVTIGGMYWNNVWSRTLENGQQADKDASSNAQITLGPALVEAHKLESEVAVYPRVVFSERLIEHIEEMAKKTQDIPKAAHVGFLCSPSPGNTPRCILDFIRPGSDGVPFFDLFHGDITRNDTARIEKRRLADGRIKTLRHPSGTTHEQFMRNVKETVESFLKESNPGKVRAKHLWLANYFNATLSHYNYNIVPIEIVWRK